jgi:hypothetical protein
VAAVPDQPRITRVNGYDVVKVGDEGGLMAADHLIRAGAERNLGPGGEIDAMNPGDEPFRIVAENAHAGGQRGGAGDDIGVGSVRGRWTRVQAGIWVGCTDPFEGSKTERRRIEKQRGNRLVDGAIRSSE